MHQSKYARNSDRGHPNGACRKPEGNRRVTLPKTYEDIKTGERSVEIVLHPTRANDFKSASHVIMASIIELSLVGSQPENLTQ